MQVPENHVKDDQSEAKVQNDVMGEKRCTKRLETRPHRCEWCPRGRGASASHRTVQARQRGKTARDGTEGPIEKRADLLLVRNSQGRDPRTQEEKNGPKDSQQQARTGEDWLRQEDREPTNGESGTHVQ